MERYLLIHYGEIYLKSGNREFFENKLIDNIKQALAKYPNLWLKKVAGRILIRLADDYDLELIKAMLTKVFGIEYFTFAWNSDQDYKQIEKNIYSLIKDKKFKTFRVTTRRTNKAYIFNSRQLAEKIGAMVVTKMKKKVDLENFDLNIHLDIVRDLALIYFDRYEARGGLPVGVSGKLICLLSGGLDSPVAANLMQKRGAKIIYLNFDSYPSTPKESQEKVKDLVKVLNHYQFDSKLYIVPFLEIQKAIIKFPKQEYRVILYRRMMYRIAQEIAKKEKVLGLITGESLGQVASQTIENIRAISQVIDLPILRPLIGSNKEEIVRLAQMIGTYEISIQPFNDCCSLYVPKHPVTHANLELIAGIEKKWDYKELIKKALQNSQIININD